MQHYQRHAACRHHGRTRIRCSATQSPVCPNLPQRRPRSMPYIIYSQSKQEVTALDVAMLLAVSKTAYQEQGSLQKRALFNHWTFKNDDISRERALRKIARSIHYSVAIVAAFTNCDVYEPLSFNSHDPHTTDSSQYNRHNSTSSTVGSQTHKTTAAGALPVSLNWFGASYDRTRQRRSLIGFARANGDGSLAATIYDLAVHPEYRQYGVGSKLLRLLTRQLYQKEVYDIGSIVPLENQSLFERNSFEDDREQSTTLSFVQHHEWLRDGLVSSDCSYQLDWLTPLDRNDTHSHLHQHNQGTDGLGAQTLEQLCNPLQDWSVDENSNASCSTAAPRTATLQHSHGRQSDTEASQMTSSTCSHPQITHPNNCNQRQQQQRWQGEANGVIHYKDPLVNVPAPATAALQNCKPLQDMLASKLQRCLGPE